MSPVHDIILTNSSAYCFWRVILACSVGGGRKKLKKNSAET